MDNVYAVLLTLLFVFILIIINKIVSNKSLDNLVYSQTYIHNLVKDFAPKQTQQREILSQSREHKKSRMVKVIVIDGKAYWVADNIFYTADTEGHDIVHDTAKPVDTVNMSKPELDKMLFILDNLGRGNVDDSSSTGNE